MPGGRPSNRDLLARTLPAPNWGGQQTWSQMFFPGQQQQYGTMPTQAHPTFMGMQPLGSQMMMMPTAVGMPPQMGGYMPPPPMQPQQLQQPQQAPPLLDGHASTPAKRRKRDRSESSASSRRTRRRGTSRKRRSTRNETDSDDEISTTYKYVGGVGMHGARQALPKKLRLNAIYKFDSDDAFNPIRCADMTEDEVVWGGVGCCGWGEKPDPPPHGLPQSSCELDR